MRYFFAMQKTQNTRNTFQRAITISIVGLAVFTVIPSLYLFLLELKWPVPYIKISTLHQWIALTGELLIALVVYKIHFREGWNGKKVFHYGRDFLIANCLFALPFIAYYSDETRADVPLIRALQEYFQPGYAVLLAVTALFVALSQIQNIQRIWRWSLANRGLFRLQSIKPLHNWLVHQLEAQRIHDEEAGTLRVRRFVERHPGAARTPLLGKLVVACLREGPLYLVSVLLLATAGLVLRLWNLDLIPPYADETNHLLAAKQIFQGVPLNQIAYTRSLYTVTLPVVLAFKLLGMSLWSARLVGVSVNILAVVPLYLLARRVNRPVAVLSVGLFVFSPWMIAVSKNVREYGYYAFFFYVIAYWIADLYDSIPEQFELVRDYRKLLTVKNILYLGLLCFAIYYAALVDRLSTFKTILILYPVAGLLLLRKMNWRSRVDRIWTLSLFVIAGIFFGAFLLRFEGERFQMVHFDTFYLSMFFEGAPQQWYFHRFPMAVIVIICAFLAIPLRDRKKFTLPFIVLTYLVSQLSFALFNFRENDRPRYGLSIQFWHILVIAVGLYVLFIMAHRLLNYRHPWVTGAVLLLLFWNIPLTLVPTQPLDNFNHPITDEDHLNMDPAYAYLQSHSSARDVLVTTRYLDQYFRWVGEIQSSQVMYYTYSEPDAEWVIYQAIRDHPCGWIALDIKRGYMWTRPVPRRDFVYEGKQVDYLGWFGDVYILRWCEE